MFQRHTQGRYPQANPCYRLRCEFVSKGRHILAWSNISHCVFAMKIDLFQPIDDGGMLKSAVMRLTISLLINAYKFKGKDCWQAEPKGAERGLRLNFSI